MAPHIARGLAVAEQNVSTRDWTTIGLGALTAAIGLYYCLAGLGFFASLQKANGPGWIGLVVGLVFLAGGLAVILRGVVRADDKSGELPASAPKCRHRHLGRVRQRPTALHDDGTDCRFDRRNRRAHGVRYRRHHLVSDSGHHGARQRQKDFRQKQLV
jgi:hypothetical protein